MASPLTQRALQTVGSSGFSRAKKLADLALKTNTDGAGGYTATGYEQAISILQPFMGSGKESEALDAQRLVAGYNNSLTKLTKKEKDQTETVSNFKLQENDAYFTSFDGDFGGFRKPADLVDATSQSLDNLLLGVINAIDEKEANGDSTDALYAYMNDLQKRADAMRDVSNKYQSGELSEGQVLDGFGYYVDTNPLDGTVRGAALLPAGMAPEGLTDGYRRLEATTRLGGSLLPVYAPAQRNADGEYVARVGDATWTGTGDGALRSNEAKNSKMLFGEGDFDIGDRNMFPVIKNNLNKGQFGVGLVGRDESGAPVDGIFYRGMDNKLYSVDQASLDAFKQDPVLAAKLGGYMPRFSPTEVRELAKESTPFTPDRVGFENKMIGFETEAEKARAEADRLENLGFFGKIGEGLKGMGVTREKADQVVGNAITDTITPGAPLIKAVGGFFANRNRQNQPDAPAPARTGNDVIDAGKEIFSAAKQKITSWFK